MRLRGASRRNKLLPDLNANPRDVGVQAQGASIITLTGWFAFAAVVAMVLVVLMGAFVAVRRLLGPRQQAYTVLVPRDGDA